MVKLTLNFIKEKFFEENYTILSKEYLGARNKLNYVCPFGHKHSITWSNWKLGSRCPTCMRVIKPTYSTVKIEFESAGYELISKEYINYKTKLIYRCPKGHIGSISRSNWLAGRRCAECSGKKKPTYTRVFESFLKAGYTLLSNNYVNCYSKLKYRCNNGHECWTTWSNWHQGVRCPICNILNFRGRGHPNWKGGTSCEPYCKDWTKEYKEFIKERDGYKCLNPECLKKDTLLSVHHIDYNKKNCKPENLITVCRSCNGRANKDRKWHTAWYKAIIKNRYNNT